MYGPTRFENQTKQTSKNKQTKKTGKSSYVSTIYCEIWNTHYALGKIW